MRKQSTLLKWVAGSAVLGCLLLSGPSLLAQSSSSSKAATVAAQQGQDKEQGDTFMGKIAKSSDGGWVLSEGYASKNPDSKTTYKLDDQEKAKQFAGKNVKVTGTLDASSNTIHISNIEPATS